jgi:predicted N-acyltransferase
MTTTLLFTKINSLPPSLKKEVDDFVEFLKAKKRKNKIKERKFGCAKGLIIMHDDFEAPLEDFKEYM